jgi:hypothetical protein
MYLNYSSTLLPGETSTSYGPTDNLKVVVEIWLHNQVLIASMINNVTEEVALLNLLDGSHNLLVRDHSAIFLSNSVHLRLEIRYIQTQLKFCND